MTSAPDFSLTDHKGEDWDLVSALVGGPVLLVFYRGDW
jgi:peroxiredoxin